MARERSSRDWLRERAALARIAELTGRVTMTRSEMEEDRQYKVEARSAWARGDYDRFSKLVWEVGPIVVEAAAVQRGQRVLDVAAGTGNVAIRAAEKGAEVIASDLAPEHFDAGRRNAARAGVELEWREADAEALPFDDESFDVVTSCFGAMFAPRHDRVASEMVRVCKRAGTIAMASFTPESLLAPFFEVFIPYMPPPREGDLPPVLWGDEDHVRNLLGSKVSSLEMTRRSYVERAESARAYRDFVKETFGPVVAVYESLADRPADRAALDEAFLQFVQRANRAADGDPVELEYEYLLVVARR